LPEQEAAQTLFARGAYDEIRVRIGKMRGIEILMKSIFVDLLRREISLMDIFYYLLCSIDYLRSSCVGDGEVSEVLVVHARFVFETFEHVLKCFRQEISPADCFDSYFLGVKSAVPSQFLGLFFDDLENRVYLVARS